MKKLLLAFPIVALLAAGCNSSQQASVQTQVPISQSTNPSPTATPTAVAENNYVLSDSQKTGWKVYTDSGLGFSVEYPATWVFDSEPYAVGFTDSTGDQWMFDVDATSTTETLQQASQVSKSFLEYDSSAPGVGLYATLEQKTVPIDGEPAIQNFYKAPGRDFYGDTQTFVIHSGKLYTISEGYGADPSESAMLQSFKFAQ